MAEIRIEIDEGIVREIGQFVEAQIQGIQLSAKELDAAAPHIANIVGGELLAGLEANDVPEFMAIRTRYEPVIIGDSISVRIYGVMIGDDRTNIWEAQEFGATAGPATATPGKPMPIIKDPDQQPDGTPDAWAMSRGPSTQTRHVGVVAGALEDVAPDLETKIGAYLATLAAKDLENNLDIKIAPGVRSLLVQAGVTPNELAQMGAGSTDVNVLTGGINIRSKSTGRFVKLPSKLKGVRLR